ncbi:hypothetical protein PV08_07139 [Exophiala spinifera]|uniref:Uncharacterized protein n=1 Tax=Exophiala spinifera TaxID=91928 RepID=A0A0D1ZND9_9EURO|nr:uncharacterized protein PV08_07139 [Exophiala spinifera]KIW14357.1 hypothetical protein PV08_07139 [Exophiala spinifera]
MSTTETVETKFLEPEEFRRMHGGGNPRQRTPRDQLQRRERAEMILNHYQLLWKYADANDKSVPQTRSYFHKVALGLKTEPIIENWLHDDDE